MRTSFTIKSILESKVAHLNQHLVKEPVKKKRSKYNNVKVEFDGKIFDSLKERDRYITNRYRQTSGEIKELACQVTFMLMQDKIKMCEYIADFVYTVIKTNELVVEDVKSPATRKLSTYRLKKKLMMAQFNIEIKEV